MNISVLLVDDHILFREALSSLINRQPDFHVIGEAGSVSEAIPLALELKPDLVLMDFSLPDGTGLEATQAILARNPDISIVFLTMHESDDRLFSAIRMGAKGYLLKNLPVAKLLVTLRGFWRGEAPLSRQMTSRLIQAFSQTADGEPGSNEQLPIDALTAREREIFHQLASGASNREIAKRLVISENTVRNHVHNVLEKLNLRNRHEVMRFAQHYKLLRN